MLGIRCCRILTPLMARVTFPRVKYLVRLFSLLNFSREAVIKLFTRGFSKLVYVGQSGQTLCSLAAGTVKRDKINEGRVRT